jgi:glycosyltransferase involved in cell wall biosynthesis
MRLVIVTSHAESFLGFRWLLLLRLINEGWEIYALAPNHSKKTAGILRSIGVEPVDIRLKRAGVSPLFDLLSLIDIYRVLRRIKPDAVLSYFVKPVVYGTLAAYFAGVKKRFAMIEGLGYVFTYPQEELNVRQKILKFAVSFLYKVSLVFAEKVIFLNQDDLREFTEIGLVQQRKSICIDGIGVDLDSWRKFDLSNEPVTFLMVARLLREKGVFEYAESAQHVKLKYPQAKFVLLGGHDANPGSIQLKQVIDWHDRGVLSWHGHVPVVEYMKAASVFVLPSYREGVPVSTMEAMAMGRPIITTDVPGCRETVVDGVNGFMVPAKDAVALAEKMIWFIENPSSIPLMGAASRKMAEEKFDVHKINEKLMQIMLGIEDEKTV